MKGLWEKKERNEKYSIMCYRCEVVCILLWAIRKKGKEKKGEKQERVPSQTSPSNSGYLLPSRSLYIHQCGWPCKLPQHHSFLSFMPDYGTPLNLRKSPLLFEISQNKAKKTPSLSTASVSPSVAGAAAAGVRPAHGQREVEQNQGPHAGPTEIRRDQRYYWR